jgi:hypothetical protein
LVNQSSFLPETDEKTKRMESKIGRQGWLVFSENFCESCSSSNRSQIHIKLHTKNIIAKWLHLVFFNCTFNIKENEAFWWALGEWGHMTANSLEQ